MQRIYTLVIGLLGASAVVLGLLDAAGMIGLKTIYVFIYALAAGIPALFQLVGWTGRGSQVTTVLLLVLVFAWLPYGWEQQPALRAVIDRLTPAAVLISFGVALFVINGAGKR